MVYDFASSNLSNDASEAMSSVIFAASRCGGNVPELQALRNLFKQRFGQDFERASVELLPGNNVNPQIKHNLGTKLCSARWCKAPIDKWNSKRGYTWEPLKLITKTWSLNAKRFDSSDFVLYLYLLGILVLGSCNWAVHFGSL